jgi:hypothetical protein
MKNFLSVLLAGSFALAATGCATANNNFGYGGQPTGVVYSGYRTPGNVSNPSVRPVKQGEACTHGLLWIAAWGNAGTDDAMKAGDITKLNNVQYENKSILSGLWSTYCTVATGE